MSDSKKVFDLRKEGNTEEAIKLARELIKQNSQDEWNQKALAWSLYDKLKQNIDRETKNEILNEIKSLSIWNTDDLLKEKVEKISSPFHDDIQQASALSKDQNNHSQARTILIDILKQDPTEKKALLTLAWVEYRILDSESPKEKEKSLLDLVRILNQMEDIDENLFENVVKKTSFHAEVLGNYAHFIKEVVATNPLLDNKNTFDDFLNIASINQNSVNLKRLVLRGLQKNLKRFPSNISLHAGWILDFLKTFSKEEVEIHEWSPYYYGRLWAWCKGDERVSQQYLIPYARVKKNEFWIWEALAEACIDKEMEIACLVKSTKCKAPEDYTKKGVYYTLAERLIEINKYDLASKTIEELRKIYNQKGKRIPDKIKHYQEEKWFDPSKIDDVTFSDFLKDKSLRAEEILFRDLPIQQANFYNKSKDSKRNLYFYDFVNEDGLHCSYKTSKELHFEKGEGVNIRIQATEHGKNHIVWYEKRNAEKWDCIPFQRAVVIHKDIRKGFLLAAISKDENTILHRDNFPDSMKMDIGKLIRVRTIRKHNNKLDTIDWTESPKDSYPDFVKPIAGYYFESDRGGFGFIKVNDIEEVFVPPFLAKDLKNGNRYQGIAIYQKEKKKNKYGWRLLMEPDEVC